MTPLGNLAVILLVPESAQAIAMMVASVALDASQPSFPKVSNAVHSLDITRTVPVIYTNVTTGCTCYWDDSRSDCACCQNGGCQCPQTYQNKCVKCGADISGCSAAVGEECASDDACVTGHCLGGFCCDGQTSTWLNCASCNSDGWCAVCDAGHAWTSGVGCVDSSSGFGDPHMVNILGEHFNIWQVGEVELLRIPRNSTESSAALRLVAHVSETGNASDDCTRAPYMTAMRMGGIWFGNRELFVKMFDGEMQVLFGSTSIAPSSKRVAIKSKLVVARPSEELVSVQIGNATIDMKHDAFFAHHFYLNMQARNLGSLGFEIGGILGLDDHSSVVQRPTNCEGNQLIFGRRHGANVLASLD